jgi:hypothetical protein
MKTDEERLIEYSETLGLFQRLTVSDLIRSHQTLRSMNVDVVEERRKHVQEAANRAYQDAYAYAMANEYIKVSDLAAMTLGELSGMLVDQQ